MPSNRRLSVVLAWLIAAALTTAITTSTSFTHLNLPTQNVRVAEGWSAPDPVPVVTIDGHKVGPRFDNLGVISGGGGDSVLLKNYPEPQRSQILDILFKPDVGANIWMLKWEIGFGGNSTNGAEPSHEPAPGRYYPNSYELWLAREAKLRNPRIKLIALQWGAPAWVNRNGTLWSDRDIKYVLDYLRLARHTYHLEIDYLGGWNEMGYNPWWYQQMRQALNRNGFRNVKLIAADSAPQHGRQPWRIATELHADTAFRNAVSVIGDHDPAQFPTTGYSCYVSPAASSLLQPKWGNKTLWASEIGKLPRDAGAAPWIRSVNRCSLAGITGFLMWPAINALPEWMQIEDRGAVTAQDPHGGSFRVNRLTWAFAQFTQFTGPGWTYAGGASSNLGNWGSDTAYLSPNRRHWSLVAENTGTRPGQVLVSRTIHVVLRNLSGQRLYTRSTNLASPDPRTWFVPGAQITTTSDGFNLTIPPHGVVSVSNFGGQGRGNPASPRPGSIPLPFRLAPDQLGLPKYLCPQDGAFEINPGSTKKLVIIDQVGIGRPVFWGTPPGEPRHPYAVLGSANWADYTVSSGVKLAGTGSWAGLIGRFTHQRGGGKVEDFNGFELRIIAKGPRTGIWVLRVNRQFGEPLTFTGPLPDFQIGSLHHLVLSLHGSTISAGIDGRAIATIDSLPDSSYLGGLAGIESSWDQVQFFNPMVS